MYGFKHGEAVYLLGIMQENNSRVKKQYVYYISNYGAGVFTRAIARSTSGPW